MVRIVTDSTSDIPPELARDIAIVPCYVQFGDDSYLDGVDLTREQFYLRLAQDAELPRTSAPSVGSFTEAYRRVAADGEPVLSLHVAAALSGVHNSARLGAEGTPDADIAVYDSETVSMGLGWLCLAAARAAREGKTIAQIVAMLDDMKERAHVFAALDTLEFLRRSGRVGWASAMVGQLLNIKPIVHAYHGSVALIERVRTRLHAIQRLKELAISLGPLECLAVLHTTAQEAALQLARELAYLAPPPMPVVEVTPVIGTHVGPNGLGLAAIVKRDV